MRRVNANLWVSLATVDRKFVKHLSILERLEQCLICCIFIVIKVGTHTHTFKIETTLFSLAVILNLKYRYPKWSFLLKI